MSAMAATEEDPISARPEVRAARFEYLKMLAGFEAAERQLEVALSEAGDAMRVIREHLEADGLASEVEALILPRELRAEFGDAFNSFERIRHKAQNRLYKLLLAEGLSYTDIANMWGISRQLVTRIEREPL
jgi:hypothetical protein